MKPAAFLKVKSKHSLKATFLEILLFKFQNLRVDVIFKGLFFIAAAVSKSQVVSDWSHSSDWSPMNTCDS
jgi:hypothetical protein